MKVVFSLFTFLFFAHCHSVEVSLEKISELNLPQEVTLRGFLYSKEDQWVLSSEPNLKTCCIGKKGVHVLLDKSFNPSQVNTVVTLQGVLTKENFYLLKEVKILEGSTDQSFLYVLLLAMPVLFLISYKRGLKP